MHAKHYRTLSRAALPTLLVCVCVRAELSKTHSRQCEGTRTAVILTVSGKSQLDALQKLAAKALFSELEGYDAVIVSEGHPGEWFANGSSVKAPRLIEASRQTERDAYGESFELFSGIYGASVKPAAIRWLASQRYYRSAWILEPDVVFTDPWQHLFKKYDQSYRADADLVAFNITFRFQNKTSWNHWQGCGFCNGLENWVKQGALLPTFRISQELAHAVFQQLSTNAQGGHHEALIPTFVFANAGRFTWIDLSPDVAYMRWRPVYGEDVASRVPRRESRLFHPVKSPEMFKRLSGALVRA